MQSVSQQQQRTVQVKLGTCMMVRCTCQGQLYEDPPPFHHIHTTRRVILAASICVLARYSKLSCNVQGCAAEQ